MSSEDKVARSELETLRDTLAAREAAFAERGERADRLEGQLQKALTERMQADAALVRTQQAAELRCAAAETEVASLRDALTARDASLAATTARADDRESQLQKALGQRAQANAALADAYRSAALYRAAAKTAEAKLSLLRTELVTLKAGLADDSDADSRIAELQASLAIAEGEAATLRGRLAQVESAPSSAAPTGDDDSRARAEAEAEAATLRDALAARDASLAATTARADDMEARLQKALAQRAQADAALAQSQQRAALLDAAAKATEAELSVLRDRLATAEAGHAEATRPAAQAQAGATPIA